MSNYRFLQMQNALFFRLFLMPMAVLLLLAATPRISTAAETTWTGCGIIRGAFMEQIAAAYEKKYGSRINISGGGATRGIRAAAAATADMGGTCRHWLFETSGVRHPQEQNAELSIVAWDALVPIVHPDNQVDNISLADLKKIYNGEITNWNQLGGPDDRIILVTVGSKSSGVGHMFRHLVFGNPQYEYKARALTVDTANLLEGKIEKTLNAFGKTGVSSARKREVKILSIDGVQPTRENIASGRYPLFRPVYMATNTGASPEARKLLSFILSDEGQQIISETGTVNLQEGKPLEALWNRKKGAMGL